MSGGRPILAVSHDAGRSGAPLVLRDFLRWVRATTDTEVSVLLLRGGPLEAQFAALGPTEILDVVEPERPRLQVLHSGLRARGPAAASQTLDRVRVRRALRRLGWSGPDSRPAAIWLNAVPSLRLLDVLPTPLPPVAAYVHELEGVIRATFPDGTVDRHLARCGHVVAASPAIADNLAARHGVPIDRLSTAFPFVAAGDAATPVDVTATLGIPAGTPIVGAVGQSGWRKGVDLFVGLARLLDRTEHGRAAHLVWVGDDGGDTAGADARADVRAAGLAGRVHFVGEQDNVAAWMAAFDVVVVPSREDPFPLTVLEAGLAKRPVAAFAGPGQNPDLCSLLGQGRGITVPMLDGPALAAAVDGLLGDAGLREAMATALGQFVASHHVVEVGAPGLWSALRGEPG